MVSANAGDVSRELDEFAGIRGMGSAATDSRDYPFGNNISYGEPIRLAITLPVTSRGHDGKCCFAFLEGMAHAVLNFSRA
jgi:hypothetical protein